MVSVYFSVQKTFSLPLRFFSCMHFLKSWFYHLRALHVLHIHFIEGYPPKNQLEILDMNVLTI